MHSNIREDLLYRLRWDILEPLANIEIATGSHNQSTNLPFANHPLTEESIAEPSLYSIEFRIADCLRKRDFDYGEEPDRYKPPASLIITNDDGRPITLDQFVARTHEYFSQNIQEIKKVKGESYGEPAAWSEEGTVIGRAVTCGKSWLPEHIRLFIDKVYTGPISGPVKISLSIYAEGEFDCSFDQFWAGRLRLVHNLEEKRAGNFTDSAYIGPLMPVPVSQIPTPEQYLAQFPSREGATIRQFFVQ